MSISKIKKIYVYLYAFNMLNENSIKFWCIVGDLYFILVFAQLMHRAQNASNKCKISANIRVNH